MLTPNTPPRPRQATPQTPRQAHAADRPRPRKFPPAGPRPR